MVVDGHNHRGHLHGQGGADVGHHLGDHLCQGGHGGADGIGVQLHLGGGQLGGEAAGEELLNLIVGILVQGILAAGVGGEDGVGQIVGQLFQLNAIGFVQEIAFQGQGLGAEVGGKSGEVLAVDHQTGPQGQDGLFQGEGHLGGGLHALAGQHEFHGTGVVGGKGGGAQAEYQGQSHHQGQQAAGVAGMCHLQSSFQLYGLFLLLWSL